MADSLKLDDKEMQALLKQADSDFTHNLFEKALPVYIRLATKTGNLQVLQRAVITLLELGQYQQALDLHTMVEKRFSNMAGDIGHIIHAKILRSQGDLDGALAVLKHCSEEGFSDYIDLALKRKSLDGFAEKFDQASKFMASRQIVDTLFLKKYRICWENLEPKPVPEIIINFKILSFILQFENSTSNLAKIMVAQRLFFVDGWFNELILLPTIQFLGLKVENFHDEFKAAAPLMNVATYNALTGEHLLAVPQGNHFITARERPKDKKIVELYIPDAIYLTQEVDQNDPARKQIRKFFSSILECLRREGHAILPIHQSMNGVRLPENRGDISFSYHTTNFATDVIHYKENYLPGYFYFDRKGYSGWSAIAEQPLSSFLKAAVPQEDVDRFYEVLHKKYTLSRVSKYEQQDALLEILPDMKYVLVALQLQDDTVATHAYLEGIEMAETVAEAYRGSDTIVLIKRHPYCSAKNIEKRLEKVALNPNVVITTKSIHDLIRVSDYVVTVNSGVGFEALLQLKPVVTCGKSDYGMATRVIKSKRELLEFAQGEKNFISTEETKKFLYVYLNQCVIDIEDTESVFQHINEAINNASEKPLPHKDEGLLSFEGGYDLLLQSLQGLARRRASDFILKLLALYDIKNDFKLLKIKGIAFLKIKRYQEAKSIFTKMLGTTGKDEDILILLLRVAFESCDSECINEVIQKYPWIQNNKEYMFLNVVDSYKKQDYQNVLRLFSKYKDNFNGTILIHAYTLVRNSAIQLGEYKVALQCASIVHLSVKKSVNHWSVLGELLIKNGKFTEALDFFSGGTKEYTPPEFSVHENSPFILRTKAFLDKKAPCHVMLTHFPFWRHSEGASVRIDTIATAYTSGLSHKLVVLYPGSITPEDIDLLNSRDDLFILPFRYYKLIFPDATIKDTDISSYTKSIFSIYRTAEEEFYNAVIMKDFVDRMDIVSITAEYISSSHILTYIDNIFSVVDLHDVFHLRELNYTKANLEYTHDSITEFDEIAMMERYNMAIAISEEEYHYLSPRVQNTSLLYIPHLPERKKHGAKKDNPHILFVGGSQASNGQGMTHFFEAIWPYIHKDAVLDVVGSVCNCLDVKNELRVNILGFVDNVEQAYANADIVIAPVYAGSGLKIKCIEALSHGIPLVTTPVGAQGLDSNDGSNFLIAESDEEFIRHLNQLITDDTAWESIGAAGAALFDRICIENDSQQLLDTLNGLAG